MIIKETTSDLELGLILARLKALEEIIKKFGFYYRIAIKGGQARRVVEILSASDPTEEYIIQPDLDLIIFHQGSYLDEMDTETGGRLKELAGKIQASFTEYRMNENIETVRIRDIQSSGMRETIAAVINSRDMTINECLLLLENGLLVLYYSEQCWRDINRRIAIFSTGSASISRLDWGRITLLPLGVERIIRFAVERKVDTIYLPQASVEMLWREANGYEPLLPYGLLLCHRYRDHEQLQARMMQILTTLGLTKAKTFGQYQEILEKEFAEKNQGVKFELKDRTFEEVFLARVGKIEKQKKGRSERKEARERCSLPHTRDRTLEGIDAGQVMTYCESCGWFEIKGSLGNILNPRRLRSNRILINANVDALNNADFRDVAMMLRTPLAPDG